jgi:hypothetical protein
MADKETKNILQKLAIVQSRLNVPKNNYNSYGKFYYRSTEDIIEAAKPILSAIDCVLLLEDEIVFIEGRFYVKATAAIYDTATESSISRHGFAREAETKTGSDVAQITGAASTYARKYALNALFAVDDTKDADADENNIEAETRAKKAKPKKSTKTAAETTVESSSASQPGELIFCDSCKMPIVATDKFTINDIVSNSKKYLNGCYCFKCGQKIAAEIKAKRQAEKERAEYISNLEESTNRLINGES